MSGDTVIRAEGLGKKYLIGHEAERARYAALRDVIGRRAKAFVRTTSDMLRGRAIVSGDTFEEFWALKDVDFEIRRGEVVGIIGHNGAGKSTLLKILSRITEPSTGTVEVRGRVASLLEVGTGFHPELSGRENVYLNGAILGMGRVEIRRKFDEIVAFAEVEKFLDTPVKRYSSGMYVRLAFAVAAHLEPEILLVDEVLAVGDVEFQKKCLGKMSTVARGGRTVLFVSHNLGAVRALTARALVLSKGRIAIDAPVDEAIQTYLTHGRAPDHERGNWRWESGARPGGGEIELIEVQLQGARSGSSGAVQADEDVELVVSYAQRCEIVGERFTFQLMTAAGEVAFTTTDHQKRAGAKSEAGRYRTTCVIPGGLLNRGRYSINIGASIPGTKQLITPLEVGSFVVEGVGNQGTTYLTDNWPGAVCPKLEWRIEAIG
jgi:lipopolysaccharide transport system ATP-binding protein